MAKKRILLIIIALLGCVYVLFNGGYSLLAIKEFSAGRFDGDFEHYYASAIRLSRGENPYKDSLQPTLNELDIAATDSNTHATNPPALILLTVPFTLLSPLLAFWLWNLFQVSFFILGASTFAKTLGMRCKSVMVGAIGIIFSYPFLFHIRHGQTQLLIAGIIMWALSLIQRRPQLGSWLLGVCASIKLFTLPLILIALGTTYKNKPFNVRALFVFTLGFLLLPLTAELFSQECLHVTYISNVLPYIRSLHFEISQGVSLSFLFFFLYWKFAFNFDAPSDISETILPLVGGLSGGLLLILIAYEYFNDQQQRNLTRSALFILTACILCSPVAWPHYFVLLYPALIYLWSKAMAKGQPRAETVLLLYLMTALTFGYIPSLPTISAIWGPLVMGCYLYVLRAPSKGKTRTG